MKITLALKPPGCEDRHCGEKQDPAPAPLAERGEPARAKDLP